VCNSTWSVSIRSSSSTRRNSARGSAGRKQRALYLFKDDGTVIQAKLVDPGREYFSGRLIRQGHDELRSTLWEATFANDRLRRRWKLRAEFTVISSSELQCRYEKVVWGKAPGQVERIFPNHSTWNKVE
jgi:hypothetical protein